MRSLLAVLAFVASAAAAEAPQHLRGLPDGVVHRGPAQAALGTAGEGGRTRVWLPGGERVFEVERVVDAGATTTRFGRIPGVGRAAITLGPDGGFGRITQGATVWLLDYRGAETWALRAGAGGLPFAPYDDGALAAPESAPRSASSGARRGGPWLGGPARTVDFAGLYDAGFAARYPGSLAATRIAHFVALANQAFVDSDVAVTLRLLQTRAVPGTVAPGVSDSLNALYAAHTAGSFGGVDVGTLRRQSGADLLGFFRIHDLYAREFCGAAIFPFDWRAGLSVVMDGSSGGSTCDHYVFAHEVGHNFGARHQPAADSNPGSAHAFVRPGQFTTLMASLVTGKPDRARHLGYYSNPRIACGNLPCGTAGSEDNAGRMNDNAARVAGYLPTRIFGTATRPAPTLADSDGDGVIDRVDAFPFDAARSMDRDGDGSADGDDAFPDNSTEWLDSDRGGLGDNADPDDDNDGTPDSGDAFPFDPLESADADQDGTGDAGDAFDADPREQRDTDGDGIGDRADADDDADGTVDVATVASAADAELLVADGATDRILRFDGSTLAPLGTLVQLGPAEVTFRSGIAAAASGEIYFVAASQLRVLDRLRSTSPVLMLDTASHPQVGTGFPLSPVVLGSGDVMLGEMGSGALLTMRPGPSRAATPVLRRLHLGGPGAPHACRENFGDLLVLDGATGTLRVYAHAGDPVTSDPDELAFLPGAVPPLSSGDTAQGANGLLYWVDRRDGAVRSFDLSLGAAGPFDVPAADAAAIAVSPGGGAVFVAQRAGGVRSYDALDGADLGLAIPAADAAEPLALAWVPRIDDTSLPPIVPPPAPPDTPDASTTPAVGGIAPPPPPCTTECIGAGGRHGGGAFDPRLALLFALLRRRPGRHLSR